MTTIDLAPLINGVVIPLLLPTIGVIVTALAGWLATKVAALLHLQADDKVRALLETALTNGVQFAVNKAASEPEKFTTHNDKIAVAVSYVATNAPDALKRFDVTPTKLAALVQARLPPPSAAA